jgi:hypothetical protein
MNINKIPACIFSKVKLLENQKVEQILTCRVSNYLYYYLNYARTAFLLLSTNN